MIGCETGGTIAVDDDDDDDDDDAIGDDDDDDTVGDPILVNGDFEDVDAQQAALEWLVYGDNPGGEIVTDDTMAQSGVRSMRYTIDAAGDGYEFFIIQNEIDPDRLVNGSRYAFRGWYRIDQLGDDISFNYLLRGEGVNDIGNDWDNTHPTNTDTWEPFDFEFTIPADASTSNYKLYIHLIKWTGNSINLWVDNVAIEPVS